MSKRWIHIISPTRGSIGEITNDLMEGLRDDFYLSREGESDPQENDILLSHFINPTMFDYPNKETFDRFDNKVLIQPIDGTEIQPEFVKYFNQFDLIITPGGSGRQILRRNGVSTQIKVVSNYWKDNILDLPVDNPLPKQYQNRVVFYHESTFHPRKGIELLYEGYVRAFSDLDVVDDVVLVLKDMPYNKLTFDRIEQLKRDIIKLQKQYDRPAKIVKISQHLQWETLKKLWNATDAYVSLAKIEGFGIPLLRFAVLQKPIITLENDNAGYMDYLNYDNCYMIETQQRYAQDEHMNLYTPDTQWAIPKDLDDVKQQFVQCYADIKTKKTKTVSPKVVAPMNFDNVMKKYINLLKNV